MNNNATRRLLVVGAGIGQVHLVKKARSQGIHVTVLTLPGPYPCIELADDVIYCDVFDREKAAAEAKARGIDAVVSDQNDLMVPTVAYIAEKLGLPGNSFAQAQSYCDKNVFRANCDRVGVPAPKHVEVLSPDFDPSTFDAPLPWIVKPGVQQSSVGVKRIDSLDELRPALDFAIKKSFNGKAILEEFFIGKELVCEGFIENGEFRLLGFADCFYFDMKDMLIRGSMFFPSRVKPEIMERIVGYEKKMAAFTRPNFSILYSEYLVNETTDEIRVVESALRGSAMYASSHLIPYSTGIDINDVLLKKALGEPVDVAAAFASRKDAAAGYISFYLREGTIVSVAGLDEIKSFDFVKEVFLDDIKTGATVEKFAHKGSRKGPILIVGKDRDELERNAARVKETLKVEVQDTTGAVSGASWE